MKVKNPILRGFYPDPSIVRVGDDYYIANSTFEWWPGVSLHHSRDLVHWEKIPSPLNLQSQLDLRGVGASQGVWAPCLTYDNGIFYLVYTVVKSFYCNMYDTANFLVTAENILGPWSEPVPLNNFGFDPSLFHDDDGRKYMVSMVTDHRVPKKYAGRLVLQEYDASEKKMIGPVREIFCADKVYLEGPHIFKRKDWYYLFAADTGTGELHGQSILRSKNVWGPYEWYDGNSILTAREHPDFLLQKSGHCDLVETQNGEWYAVHLCGRALEHRNPDDAPRFPGARRYTLGRETCIQKMKWTEDDWLVLANGTTLPDLETEIPDELAERAAVGHENANETEQAEHRQGSEQKSEQTGGMFDDFDNPTGLSVVYQTLRQPLTPGFWSLTERPGYLRLRGQEGLSSRFNQSLIARRWEEFCFETAACVEFEPEVFKQMAGLILLYDQDNYFYLHLTFDEEMGKCITLLIAENKRYCYPAGYVPIESGKPVCLKAQVDHDKVQFSYAVGGKTYQPIGPVLDASILSDEACNEGWFTGAMAGICCQDLTGFGKEADFDWFSYKNIKE